MSTETDAQRRASFIMGFALMAGAWLFAAVAVALPFLGFVPEAADPELADVSEDGIVGLLSLVHGVLFLVLVPIALFLPNLFAQRANLPPEQAQIIRWAQLEGAALFGCVVVLLAGLEGILPSQPIYYLNLLSTGFLTLVILADLSRLAAKR